MPCGGPSPVRADTPLVLWHRRGPNTRGPFALQPSPPLTPFAAEQFSGISRSCMLAMDRFLLIPPQGFPVPFHGLARPLPLPSHISYCHPTFPPFLRPLLRHLPVAVSPLSRIRSPDSIMPRLAGGSRLPFGSSAEVLPRPHRLLTHFDAQRGARGPLRIPTETQTPSYSVPIPSVPLCQAMQAGVSLLCPSHCVAPQLHLTLAPRTADQ
jgi:hypothetical protein